MTDYKVLCIGSAVVDISASPIPSPDQWKEKQRIGRIGITTGGDAANQSIRLADAGVPVSLAACTGTDSNGSFLISALGERGVDTRWIRRVPEAATSTALVLVDAAGERRTFSTGGAHPMLCKEDVWAALKQDPEKQGRQKTGALSLASLFSMPLLEKDGLEDILAYCQSRGILVFADLASDKLGQGLGGIRRFLPYIDYFMPSLYDAVDMTRPGAGPGAGTGGGDGTLESPRDMESVSITEPSETLEPDPPELDLARQAASVYLDCGAKHVIIKCGALGCLLAWPAGRAYSFFHIPAVRVEPVDTTGAGDCMAALFISRILEGDDMVSAARFAACGASLSTLHAGASGHKLEEKEIRDYMDEPRKSSVEADPNPAPGLASGTCMED